MYICNYCGRYLKKHYDNCPACGANTFKKVQSISEMVIDKPPEGGYKVNLDNLKLEQNNSNFEIIILISIIIISSLLCLPYFLFDFIFLFFIVITILIGVVSGSFIILTFSKEKKESKKEIERIRKLAKNGILIKNLKYRVRPVAGNVPGYTTAFTIQVSYEIKDGKEECFESEVKYLSALGREDGTVDLLIDPNDYSNYFIDFEIY